VEEGLLVRCYEVRHEYLTDDLAVQLSQETQVSARAWLLLSAAFQATRPVATVLLPVVTIRS
jgi:hypothetical protein